MIALENSIKILRRCSWNAPNDVVHQNKASVLTYVIPRMPKLAYLTKLQTSVIFLLYPDCHVSW